MTTTTAKRDESQPLAVLVKVYGPKYEERYRSAYEELPVDRSTKSRDRVRSEVAHWAALSACGHLAGSETLAGLAHGYAEQQTAGGCGNANAAREYALKVSQL